MVSNVFLIIGDPLSEEASATKAAKGKKKVKKTEKKERDLSIFDDHTPNIFDDPLKAP